MNQHNKEIRCNEVYDIMAALGEEIFQEKTR